MINFSKEDLFENLVGAGFTPLKAEFDAKRISQHIKHGGKNEVEFSGIDDRPRDNCCAQVKMPMKKNTIGCSKYVF